MATTPITPATYIPQRREGLGHPWSVNPIDHDLLVRMINAGDHTTRAGVRDSLILGVGWELALRLGKLAALTVADIASGRLAPSPAVMELFDTWMGMRAADNVPPAGPLFVRVYSNHAVPGKGLSADTINRAVIQGRIQMLYPTVPHPEMYSSDSLYLGGLYPSVRLAPNT